jgi:phosphoglycerate dehydrogenase-like enzyme
MISLLHIAARKPSQLFTPLFLEHLNTVGSLTIVENGDDLSEADRLALLRETDVALTGWDAAPIPAAIVHEPGKLRYVCHVTGEMKQYVPEAVIRSDILVSNWGDSPAVAIAEGTVALLLAVLKDLPRQVVEIRAGGWSLSPEEFGGSLYEASLGVYGCGAIGRRFVELIRLFGPRISVYDPYATELPDGCGRADSLDELFGNSEIIVICAGLTDETRVSVTAELLAKLPRHGVLINTARGAIVDQDALFAELEHGRLRAGLDVLEPDRLPDDHPARQWTNVIFTAHEINRGWPTDGKPSTRLSAMHTLCLENLRSFAQGRPIRFEMDLARYRRST